MTTIEMPDVIDKVMESVEFTAKTNGFHREPRCRVCRNDEVCATVNNLLAKGSSYAMVVRALGEDNEALDKRDRVTIDSVRNHAARHFPVQNVGKATYREIAERRAKESQTDFVNGVATAITPLAVLETIMVRGYETLVDDRTVVSYRDGLDAALKLEEIRRRDEGSLDKAQLIAEMGRIIDTVKEFVPKEKWPELQARLGGEPPSASTSARVPEAEPVRMVPISVAEEDEPYD